MIGLKVKFNWDAMNKDRGDLKVLKDWYEKDKTERTIAGEFINFKNETRYEIEGIAGAFAKEELIFIR